MASPISPRTVALREITQRPVRVIARPEENGVQQPTSAWYGIEHLRPAPDARQAAEGRLRQARRGHPARQEARHRHRADRRAGHQGMGDVARRHALHALVPAADRPHRREARRLPQLRRERARRSRRSRGEQLIQSEPDASSFPSGGLRATWEARGYTAWNPASARCSSSRPAASSTLCIPSVFIGYNGEALDEMTPLLRSSDVLSHEGDASCSSCIGDKGVLRVIHHARRRAGVLPDRPRALRAAPRPRHGRPLARRRAAAARPAARGPLLRWHPRARAGLHREVEHELYKLGVPIVTRHNEVAPSPVRDGADLRRDRHRRRPQPAGDVGAAQGRAAPWPAGASLHEKPFAGINGSGKHCNWSMAITADNALDGINLLKPGKTPHQNLRFLLFLAAVLKGVHKHAGLLRAGIATSGNEHRLGANEAPPAIISVVPGRDAHAGHRGHRRRQDGAKSAEQAHAQARRRPSCPKSSRTTPTATARRRSPSPARSSSSAPSARRSRIAFPVMLLQRRGGRGHRRDHRRARARSSRRPRASTTPCSRSCARRSRRRRPCASRATTTPTSGSTEAAEARPAQPAPHAGSARAAARPKSRKALFTALGILTDVGAREPLPRAHRALREGHPDRAAHAAARWSTR